MNKKVLLINCAYKKDSVTDQMMGEVHTHLNTLGVECEMLTMREESFTACINCRVCTQCSEALPGECVNQDTMNDIVHKIEESHAYVIATPAKFQTTSKVFKTFFNRLLVYSYWPFGAKDPLPKKERVSKKAVLISAFPIPNFVARLYSKTMNQLKRSARLIGAEPIDTVYLGMAPMSLIRPLRENEKQRAYEVSKKLYKSI